MEIENYVIMILIFFLLISLVGCTSNTASNAAELSCDNPRIEKVGAAVDKDKYSDVQAPEICRGAFLINAHPDKEYEVSCKLVNKADTLTSKGSAIGIGCECLVCDLGIRNK